MTPFHKLRGQMSESMLTASFVILSGGLQDAYTYLCRGKVFANGQTGNIVLFSAYLFAVGFLPQTLNTVANALVSFSCAMQLQTFRKVRGHAYASTMCVGNMRNGTEALCAYFHTREPEALRNALTYFGVIGLFALGAGLGALLSGAFSVRGIWASCGLLAVSFLVMFVHTELEKG